jgi:GT2 family glycosyltransferase
MYKNHSSDNYKISIIIPTVDRIKLLKKCLDVVSAQSVDKNTLQVIVVNDGGNHKLFAPLLSCNFNFELKIIDLPFNKGPAIARNYGIDHADGEIIVFLDDDSLPHENWFKNLLEAWEKMPYYDGIGGYLISPKDTTFISKISSDLDNWFLEQNNYNGESNFFGAGNASYKKNALKNIGGFSDCFKFASGEERDLNFRLIKNGAKLKIMRNILVFHERKVSFINFFKRNSLNGATSYIIHKKHPEIKFYPPRSYIDLYFIVVRKYPGFYRKIAAIILIFTAHLATLYGYLVYHFINRKCIQSDI